MIIMQINPDVHLLDLATKQVIKRQNSLDLGNGIVCTKGPKVLKILELI